MLRECLIGEPIQDPRCGIRSQATIPDGGIELRVPPTELGELSF